MVQRTDMKNQLQDEKVVELLLALGNAYLENGESDKAVEKFKQLYQSGSKDAAVLTSYASALAKAGSISDEALIVYADAIEVNKENENLHLTLAELFLKREIKQEPALLVYRRTLNFSPPFEDDIRAAIEKIFQETTQTLTLTEIRETLLECVDSPELLSIFVATARRDKKYDETLTILKEIYTRTNNNQVYLKAICETLLEQKAHYEETGKAMALKSLDVQFCLKYQDIDLPVTRINEIETYLDFKNLFLSYQESPSPEKGSKSEYEFILTDNTIETIEEATESRKFSEIEINITPSFSLKADFIEKIRQSSTGSEQNKNIEVDSLANWEEQDAFLEYQINTIAIFEIKNYDASPDASKLPYQTLMKLIASELAQSHIFTLCTTVNGIITFCTNPRKMLEKALETNEKVERYNQVVDESEVIELRTTLHCSKVPFIDLEYQGIKEVRKAIKVHNTGLIKPQESENSNGKNSVPTNTLYITKEVTAFTSESGLTKVGDFKFGYFPGEHPIFKVSSIGKAPETSSQPESTTITKQHFGKYEIVEPILENSLTNTYKGYDPQLERPVLIKVYKTQAFSNFKEFMPLRKQFYEEVRKFNRINHPNIGVIYDAGEDGDLLYLVREFIEGKNLFEYIKDKSSNNLSEILAIFVHVCRIVAFYHQNKVWHKNLKPQNIFVFGHDDIKVVDGGLLQVHHSDKLWDEMNEELAYVAPEQIKGAKLTLACDIYQIAVILYELLTGLNPFYSSSPADTRVRIIADDPPPVSSYRSDIPEELDNILIKALLKNPEKRFATIKEFELALSDIVQKHDITTRRRLFELL